MTSSTTSGPQASPGLAATRPLDLQSSPGPAAPIEPYGDFYRREFAAVLALSTALVGPLYAEQVALEAMLAARRCWRTVGAERSPAVHVLPGVVGVAG